MWRQGGALLVGLGLGVVGVAAEQAPSSSVPTPASSATSDYVFRATTGLLVFHVRPEAVRDFEAVMTRVEQGLAAATDPVRRQQRASWRLFRSADAPAGSAVYVALVDPVTSGADYDPVRMITEFLPTESQDLFARLKAAVLKVERISLAPLAR